jgi:hypothetical protein
VRIAEGGVFSFSYLAWFQPSPVGGFPVPNRWPGWVALGLFVALIAASVRLNGELAWMVRVSLCVAYVTLGYATLSSD